MLNSSTLNSLIEKLIQRPDKSTKLVFNTDAASRTLTTLKNRVTSLYIPEHSFIVVSAFLQNFDTSILTNEELEVLLMFDYSSINAVKVLPDLNTINYNEPLFDLGGTLINLDFDAVTKINGRFRKLHSIHKSLSIEYLISYISSQL